LSDPPIEAVVLDMDGLLIDTEPVWRVAEVAVFTESGHETDRGRAPGLDRPDHRRGVPIWRRRQPAGRLKWIS